MSGDGKRTLMPHQLWAYDIGLVPSQRLLSVTVRMPGIPTANTFFIHRDGVDPLVESLLGAAKHLDKQELQPAEQTLLPPNSGEVQ